jgi:hypothetical protein
VVDAGQVHQRSPHLPLVERSDVVLWVYRPTAWSALHTRRRLEGLAGMLADSPSRTGIVGVATQSQEADVVAAAQGIVGDWEWPRVFGTVASDPRAVAMFEGGQVHRPERTLLARSGRTLAEKVFEEVRRSAFAGEQLAQAHQEHEEDVDQVDASGTAEPAEDTGGRGRGRRRARRRERTS